MNSAVAPSEPFFFFSSRRPHTSLTCDWSSDVCSSDLGDVRKSFQFAAEIGPIVGAERLDEPLLRCTPHRQAFRQRALAFWGQGQKSLTPRAAFRNRDEPLLFQKAKAPRQCRVVDDE